MKIKFYATLFLIFTVIGSGCLKKTNNSNPNANPNNNPNNNGEGGSPVSYGIKWANSISSGLVNSCTGPVVVQLVDNKGNSINSNTDLRVDLASDQSNLNFYSDAGCTISSSSLVIPSGYSSYGFYIKDSDVQTIKVTASYGDSEISFNSIINPLSSTGDTLALINGTSGKAGICSGPINIGVKDSSASFVAAPADISFNVLSSSTTVEFYTNSDCSIFSNDFTINQGSSATSIFFKQSTIGDFTVNIGSSIGSLAPVVTMGSGTATHMVLSSGQGTQGDCVPVYIGFNDDFGNSTTLDTSATINLILSANGATYGAYSDSSCRHAISSIAGAVGKSSLIFWVTDSGHGYMSVEADSVSFASSSINVTFHCSFWAGCSF